MWTAEMTPFGGWRQFAKRQEGSRRSAGSLERVTAPPTGDGQANRPRGVIPIGWSRPKAAGQRSVSPSASPARDRGGHTDISWIWS